MPVQAGQEATASTRTPRTPDLTAATESLKSAGQNHNLIRSVQHSRNHEIPGTSELLSGPLDGSARDGLQHSHTDEQTVALIEKGQPPASGAAVQRRGRAGARLLPRFAVGGAIAGVRSLRSAGRQSGTPTRPLRRARRLERGGDGRGIRGGPRSTRPGSRGRTALEASRPMRPASRHARSPGPERQGRSCRTVLAR